VARLIPDAPENGNDGAPDPARQVAAPSLALPKGGGAIRGIGEKFAANPVTGTATFSVPIGSSPGRSGFGPQLSLSYDSGHGNGPFGFGWTLSTPAITRKTEKGLPLYRDDEESDVFILTGAEDLVPGRGPDGSRFADTSASGYTVRRYRPRVEGLFARIERWTRWADGDVHWRSISRDNVLTLYGKDDNSRIADPTDPGRIFSWLICETRDSTGNATLYEYKPEDGAGVDLRLAHEHNRGNRDDPRRSANRYIKRIRYGNREPLLEETARPRRLTSARIARTDWMFDLVFDYGEHDANAPTPDDAGSWSHRADPFSVYRPGFEVRTCRRCERVLMFHHIPDLPTGEGGYDGLVRSTEFSYSQTDATESRSRPYSFIVSVDQRGFRRDDSGGYLSRSLPTLEFEYSTASVEDTIRDVDGASLENLPIGLDNTAYRWIDAHGEGIAGVMFEQGGAWLYKRNISPISERSVEFAPSELVAAKPAVSLQAGQAQFLDLAGDGKPDVAILDGPAPGLWEHDDDDGWRPFRPFTSRVNRDIRDPNTRFIDLDGDGRADILITEDHAFAWHLSLAEEGFGPVHRVAQALDEDSGPKLIFSDAAQSIYLADLSGDGLTDLLRLRNGDVCYWPNLGYGRFGAKITMDNAPMCDEPDLFDHRRIRLADIDGTGTTDIIYLHRNGVRLYFNECGNSWSEPQMLNAFPPVDDLESIVPVDLLGNGTACLVWSSPLPDAARRPMRYVDLMGGQKPHLLVRTVNNLGAETRVRYASSTRFYLQDKRDGRPWITRLPFPVHVVEYVETYDHISSNRFVKRYAYHHGYFDGVEREFRGFGMVEHWDTEALEALTGAGDAPESSNAATASELPPVHTKSWFHTGASVAGTHVSDFFASGRDSHEGEYYREPGRTDAEARALELPDTVLPGGLTDDEEREACRALKGSLLREEVYALDGTPREPHPYSVTEQNFGIRVEQRRGENRHAVVFTHPREAITYHYERNPADPRVQHALTLEVDACGNVLKELVIGYGRRRPDASLPSHVDREKQTRTLITYAEHRVTNPIDDVKAYPDDYRTPLPAETRTYELTGFRPGRSAARFGFEEWTENHFAFAAAATDVPYEKAADGATKQKRLVEHLRRLYRPDDLGVETDDPSTLLPLGTVQRFALQGETYRLAFTQGLLAQVFQRDGRPLSPRLGEQFTDAGGYVSGRELKADARFPADDPDDDWWSPSGRIFLSPETADTAAQELAYARQHFFLPARYRDPFHTDAISTESFVTYDAHDLLMIETRDALGNRVTVGERLADDEIDAGTRANDYRVLQPWRVMDSNGNRTEVAFDALGMVVSTAVMGKPGEHAGDSMEGFVADLSEDVILDCLDRPLQEPHAVLRHATTRRIYDFFAYQRSKNGPVPQPAVVYSLARETHDADLEPGEQARIQHSFAYSDGFGREIQKKIQAEPGALVDGGPETDPRWVGSGWTVFNNKGKPVRRYEPFFCTTHRFEFGVEFGVSPILFYDPAGRVVATLHPNRTYEKVSFDPWRQVTWDVNDTVLNDPRMDAEIRGYTAGYFESLESNSAADAWRTWHALRKDGGLGAEERLAAQKAAAHADTPTTAHFDTLGRPFLTLADNGPDPAHSDRPLLLATRVEVDVEGNQREVRDASEQSGDALGRIIERYAYDLRGNRVYQLSMDGGARWSLGDIAGKPIRAWDSRGRRSRNEYDPLRRQVRLYVMGADPANPDQELLTDRLVYGEQHPDHHARNLRGKLYLHLDQSGAASTETYDFKGNALEASRRIAYEYRTAIDWRPADAALPASPLATLNAAALEAAVTPLLETDAYSAGTTYDALNRPATLTTPHTSAMQPSVIRNSYNAANLLERVDARLSDAAVNGQLVWTPFVTGIDYDAKGQRRHIAYGNGTRGVYEYDPQTFRLVRLVTRRPARDFRDDRPEPPPDGWPGCEVQHLHYTYDPAGNIVHIRDAAQQTIFFRNRRVEPSVDYTYDAIYRLVAATGREHLGQTGGVASVGPNHNGPVVGIPWAPNDGNAMGRYIERYLYDSVGNLLSMQHRGSDGASPGWTRVHDYEEPSLIEHGEGATVRKTSNRLSSTTVGNAETEHYVYDAHGNMTRMPHLGGASSTSNMHWDYRDQLRQTALAGGGSAYYTYDADGQRVRKICERSGNLVEERIYLGALEIYRRRQGVSKLERETLHIMDGRQCLALVEARTADTANSDRAPQRLIRYQLSNHLGSTCLELDERARVVTYEEYTPFGSTSYYAVQNKTETPKRYRFTGKERDEESGLYYHGARYYAPWLAQWTSVDPALVAVPGRERQATGQSYQYVGNRPTVAADPDGRIIWFAVIAIVAIATVTIESDANAPADEEEARRAKPSISNAEFATRTGVIGISWFAGGAVGGRILLGTGSKVFAGAGGGAFGGFVGGPGDLLASDAFRGQLSSGGDYASRTAGSTFGGMLVGGTFGTASRVVNGPAQPPPGGFGWNNVFGVPSMRPGRAADVADAFESRFGQPPEGMYVVGSRAEAYRGPWPEGSSPQTSDIDLVIQSDIPNVTKWTPEGFEFLKDINPGRVPPEVTGIGVGPGQGLIGSGPGNIPKGGLIDPFVGPSGPDSSLGPSIRLWPPTAIPQQLSDLAGPVFDRVWQLIRAPQPVATPATP
jgi:RHS repeat-associated protein